MPVTPRDPPPSASCHRFSTFPCQNELTRHVRKKLSLLFGLAVAALIARETGIFPLLMLYSDATGQKTPLSGTTPQSWSLAEMGSKLYRQATYVNGTPYPFQSNLPVAGGYSTGTYPTPGLMTLQVNVSARGGPVRRRPGRDAGVRAGSVVERGIGEQRAIAEFGGGSAAGIGDCLIRVLYN
jgi:hypothetical protein